MKFLKTNFFGDNNLGLYGFASDDYCLLGLEPKNLDKMEKILQTEIKIASISNTQFIGLFCAGNKNGIIINKIIEDHELKKLKQLLDINIQTIGSAHTAEGNLILCNDNGCLISGKLKRHKRQIEDCLGVETETGIIGDHEIIGSVAVANNKGCLVSNDITDEQVKKIESLLKVNLDVGSITGSPFIKSGIIVNSKGCLFSDKVTGPEMQRIQEVFE